MTTTKNDIPEAYDYELTIKFRMTTFDAPLPGGVATLLSNVLDDYSDGRLPFEVEMLYEGLNSSMKQTLWHHCQKVMQQKHGNEMVPHENGRGSTAKWYLEAKEMFKDAKHPSIHQCPQVTIERTRK